MKPIDIENKLKHIFSKKNIRNTFTWTKTKNFILGTSVTKKMFRIYFSLLLLFAILLYLPISFQIHGSATGWTYFDNAYHFRYENPNGTFNEDYTFNFFDSLFMSFSAFTNTGLSIGAPVQIFSIFGIVVLMFAIQLGGFGIMFFIFLFWKMVNKMDKLSINNMLLAQSEKGNTKIGDTPKMLGRSIIWILTIEIIFTFIYSLWFFTQPAYLQETNGVDDFLQNSDKINHLYNNYGYSLLTGFFHSVSSINNAGFDIIGSSSLAPYRYGAHNFLLFLTAVQFIIGGIGFPILYDIVDKFRMQRTHKIKIFKKTFGFGKIKFDRLHKFSLFTKVSVSSYFIISLLAIPLVLVFEMTSGFGPSLFWTTNIPGLSDSDKVMQLVFQSFSTRSAGFSTFNLDILNPTTKWLFSILMFIGGSPSSTAGGIRTTTIAICLMGLLTKLKGKNDIVFFKRRISQSDTINSYIILFVGCIIIGIGGFILSISAYIPNLSTPVYTNAIFLSSSAFGTTGLSVMNIDNIDVFGKIYLMFLMFIGQYSISSTILSFNKTKLKSNRFKYLTENVKIG